VEQRGDRVIVHGKHYFKRFEQQHGVRQYWLQRSRQNYWARFAPRWKRN
jgi:single-stranded DNA-binding protein